MMQSYGQRAPEPDGEDKPSAAARLTDAVKCLEGAVEHFREAERLYIEAQNKLASERQHFNETLKEFQGVTSDTYAEARQFCAEDYSYRAPRSAGVNLANAECTGVTFTI
ncbi:hypothetical protein [Henriciella sp.]|uniref:hypothetical protein n=1 Tax=Henriciella sp. TaxID=1968823 RepID=UPI002638944B|nr:hypothetical protein [Henriciella sp.]